MWFEVAMVMTIFAIGNIFFGHFEENTPKWRRVLKVFVFLGLVLGISSTLGRAWAMGFLAAVAIVPFVVIHLWWLPKHGINGWTGEPREKYYHLRGWDHVHM
jgi:small-conductance mechanosensitive channel